MKNCSVFALAFALYAGGSIVHAADQAGSIDIGKRDYDSKCAACHGLTGKGDGPFAVNLTKKPTDLTLIAKNNKGVIPVRHLEAVIDGRAETSAHGPRDLLIWGQELNLDLEAVIGGKAQPAAQGPRNMPTWGQVFAVEAGSDWPVYMGVPFNHQVFVRSRIMALIDYIARLQAK